MNLDKTLDQDQPVNGVTAGIIVALWLGLVTRLIRLILNLDR